MCVDISVIKYLQLHTSLNRKISLISYTSALQIYSVLFSFSLAAYITVLSSFDSLRELTTIHYTALLLSVQPALSTYRGNMTRWRSPLWWVTGHNKLTGHRSVNHHHILLLHTQHTGQTRSQGRAWGTLDQQIQATITTPQPIWNLPRDKQQTLKPVIAVNWTKQGRLLDLSLCNYDMCWFITGAQVFAMAQWI